MCERVRWIAAIGMLISTHAWAQDAAALRRRVARLESALRAAEIDARRSDSLARDRTRYTEIISIGALRVWATPELRAATHAAMQRIWPLVDSTFGSAVNQLATHPIAVVRGAGDRYAAPREARSIVFTTGSGADLDQRLTWAAASTMAGMQDSALATWLHGILVPMQDLERELRATYVALVTAPSPAARRCFQGDLSGCRMVLGLTSAAQVAEHWYDGTRQRAIVQDMEYLDEVRRLPMLYESCVTDRVDADCKAVLDRVSPVSLPDPLPAAARITLTRVALASGGRDAYRRLQAGPTRSIETRLAGAAAVAADTLLSAWHRRVLAARPQAVGVTPSTGWGALAWVVMLAVFALRSSRWR